MVKEGGGGLGSPSICAWTIYEMNTGDLEILYNSIFTTK